MSQYEIDFTVRDKITGAVICAIELDGPTHDTEDGRRRDSNKNRWLAEARIKLIRIRHPDEANNIRSLIDKQRIEELQEKPKYKTPHEILSMREIDTDYINPDRSRPHWDNRSYSPSKKINKNLVSIAVTAITLFAVWLFISHMIRNQQERLLDSLRQLQQRAAQQQVEALQHAKAAEDLRRQQEATTTQQPRYERMLVRGKSARECARPDGTLDNYTVRCMQDHDEMVLVNGHQ